MKVKVTKETNNPNTFRTPLDKIDSMPKPPEIGKGLILMSTTFESGGIITSNVKSFSVNKHGYTINTLNSTYYIEPIKESHELSV